MYSNDDAPTEEIAEALKKLSKALKAEEMFWKKKSRVLWLREGNRNLKVFRQNKEWRKIKSHD